MFIKKNMWNYKETWIHSVALVDLSGFIYNPVEISQKREVS